MECNNESIRKTENTKFEGLPEKAETMSEQELAITEKMPEGKVEEKTEEKLQEDTAEKIEDKIEETEQPMAEEKKSSMTRGRKIAIISIASVVLVLVGIYIGFSIYFMNHFYPGTRIDGGDCSCMAPAAVEKELQNQLLTYQLLIAGRNGLEETITASDVAMTYEFNGELWKIMKEQNGFLWFTALFDQNEYNLQKELQFDEEKLEKAVVELQVFDITNIKEPQNAYISDYIPEEKGIYYYTRE